MDIEKIIDQWILASNNYDTEKYLEFYDNEAVLDDASVGRKFVGIKGIRNYFESYFIGYQTQTKKVNLKVKDDANAYLEVLFLGDFPEGEIGGFFDFKFENGKIIFISADLL
ncbi:hypothetical protein B0A79_12245 [Flavobacterium piscis]|uniref:SnoaL-like domain-containing protein n=1 Tax=Flavobacterium piscis TaxID=1114874 RepID=A0ABX2XPZ6_9FLAO|nr:nuclear transport factor 2 family protein [Flavobacterium piscis]OCB78314.1 hypothetical protein FLP_01015 [Flavobacterium piscis]OXG04236.1 hypothetical protein B0A79_12245 [Flavobacterium piscis]